MNNVFQCKLNIDIQNQFGGNAFFLKCDFDANERVSLTKADHSMHMQL